jgi:hypothetical protein
VLFVSLSECDPFGLTPDSSAQDICMLHVCHTCGFVISSQARWRNPACNISSKPVTPPQYLIVVALCCCMPVTPVALLACSRARRRNLTRNLSPNPLGNPGYSLLNSVYAACLSYLLRF